MSEIHRIGKSIEIESTLVFNRGSREGDWEMTADGYGISLWDDENVSEFDNSDGYTTQ